MFWFHCLQMRLLLLLALHSGMNGSLPQTRFRLPWQVIFLITNITDGVLAGAFSSVTYHATRYQVLLCYMALTVRRFRCRTWSGIALLYSEPRMVWLRFMLIVDIWFATSVCTSGIWWIPQLRSGAAVFHSGFYHVTSTTWV
nr:hypothetical protein SEVIR_9G438175v2 [Setaria viridis]